jgi:hypothetical protein
MSDHRETTPDGIDTIVVFDTNTYRYLTTGCDWEAAKAKTAKLREVEKAAGVMALANPFVIWELVGHLADQNDPHYKACLNALVSLATHTCDDKGGLRRIEDGDTAVCRQLFQVKPAIAEQNTDNLSLLAAHIRDFGPVFTDQNALTNFRVFAAKLAEYEARWLAEMQIILDTFSPGLAKAWIGGNSEQETRKKVQSFFTSQQYMDLWAVAKVTSFAEVAGIKLSLHDLKSKAELMKKVFPVPFHLTKTALRNWTGSKDFILSNPKQSRANYVWDTALCFTIGNHHQIGDAPITFITSDGAIKTAATDAKCSARVLTLDEYLASISFIPS